MLLGGNHYFSMTSRVDEKFASQIAISGVMSFKEVNSWTVQVTMFLLLHELDPQIDQMIVVAELVVLHG